jgi:hypothetical protein
MAIHQCRRTGQTLQTNETCALLCDEFPACCLATPSPDLLAALSRLRQPDQNGAVATTLARLIEAIGTGLARKER